MRNRIGSLLVVALVVLALASVGGCGRARKPAKEAPRAPVKVEEKSKLESQKGGDLAKIISPVKAAVPDYAIQGDLSNVKNLRIFQDTLNADQRKLIAKNGFAVSPTNYVQMFQIYEENNYERPQQIPAFITADAMLHTYHIFYDFSLRNLETGKLYSLLETLTAAMLKQSEQDYKDAATPRLKETARGVVAYFAVAMSLLGKPKTPAYVAAEVKIDLAKIEGHKERAKSDVLSIGIQPPQFIPVGVDFTQFVPRGHYTRSDQLKRYFKAMMWYGLASFALPDKKDDSDIPTTRALLIARALNRTSTMSLWESIYEPTAFYVGVSDDVKPSQYLKLSDQIYGKNPAVNALADAGKLKTFIEKAKKLPGPGIENFIFPDSKFRIPTGLQLRFMGQRFIADSRVLQELTHPKVLDRYFPKGLDVFSAMGSKRAHGIMDKTYGEVKKYPDYMGQMKKMRSEIAATPLERWRSNLYYGWLWSMWPLTQTFGEGYPSFMRNEAWADKSLNTGLGWWAELRHDTILYAKQSVAECGGDGEPPKLPKGYVEPNVELWSRLLWLTDRTEQGLKKRNLLTDKLAERLDWMSGWLKFLKEASLKELAGKELTEEEYQKIKYFGAELENQMVQFYGGSVISETDKNMAVIADVHTSMNNCLEEGVGHASAIYVVVPIGGKLWLTRGAVFTYYEFKQPSSNRLTDEAWQKMLKTGKTPPPPEWTRSFVAPGKKAPAPPESEWREPFGGC